MPQTRTYQIEIIVIVDDEDAAVLDRLDSLYKRGQMQAIATRNAINAISYRGYHGVHRGVLAAQGLTYGKGFVADHIDNNPGNNRRNNLRIVTHRQNRLTAIGRREKQSDYNGISWHEKTGKWKAQPQWVLRGKSHGKNLGLFDKEEDAARAYDTYVKASGIDKPLNFPAN